MRNNVGRVTTSSVMTKNVEDVSHKPRRLQCQIEEEIKQEQELYGEPVMQTKTIDTPLDYSGAVPRFLTKEKAIHYFEQNASGEVAELYLKTALWLRESLSSKKDYSEVLKTLKEKDLSSSNVDELEDEEDD